MTAGSITDAVFGVLEDWTQPLLTHYDHESGERTELSGATLGNWAAKSANFFVDEAGFDSGDILLVDLPEHWQTVAILLGAWWAGARVVLPEDDPDPTTVLAVVTARDRIDHYDDVDEVLVASLDPFALGVRDLPIGVTDFATAVRAHGDRYSPRTAARGPVLDDATTEVVLAGAAAAAQADGVGAGDRVLTLRPWRATSEIVTNLLAPLVAGASLITVAHADEAKITDLASTERASVVLR
ncbi:TIGR03089 family protein [Gordonia rhizosphera]|uniref:TIGR03089 family protein n=1 Tax=Gordonia rhizosphera NBRC 16068 TaxID=1108045 RepID=K6UYB5_9ACTN|nr:TIGR03089 family protein [Gordonia rhizosphera]GAB88413.1 hypothetical protein GORHZ_018_00740 [Gordonia rhizosphera NBRC 16068]